MMLRDVPSLGSIAEDTNLIVTSFLDMNHAAQSSRVNRHFFSFFCNDRELQLCRQITKNEAKKVTKEKLILAFAQLCAIHPNNIVRTAQVELRIFKHAMEICPIVSKYGMLHPSTRVCWDVRDEEIIVGYSSLSEVIVRAIVNAYCRHYGPVARLLSDEATILSNASTDNHHGPEPMLVIPDNEHRRQANAFSIIFDKTIFCADILPNLRGPFPASENQPDYIFASIVAAQLNVSDPVHIKNTELFETVILRHALQLDFENRSSISRDLNVTGRATYNCIGSHIPLGLSSLNDENLKKDNILSIHYDDLTDHQYRELVKLFNEHYGVVARTGDGLSSAIFIPAHFEDGSVREGSAGSGVVSRSCRQGLYFYKDKFLEKVLPKLSQIELQKTDQETNRFISR
jgi:hypothetical protein